MHYNLQNNESLRTMTICFNNHSDSMRIGSLLKVKVLYCHLWLCEVPLKSISIVQVEKCSSNGYVPCSLKIMALWKIQNGYSL